MNLGNQFDNNQFTHSPSVPHVSHDNDGRDNHYALNLDELGTFAQADLSAWDDPTSSSLNPATIFHDHAKQQPSLPPQSFSAPQSAQFHSPYSAQQYLDPSVGTSTISHGFPNSANVFQQHQPSTTTNAATVAPGALQSNQFNPTQQSPRPAPVQQRGPSGSLTSPYHPAQLPPVPAGNRVGRFYSIPLDLVKAKTHSRAINPFVALGSAAYDIPTTKCKFPLLLLCLERLPDRSQLLSPIFIAESLAMRSKSLSVAIRSGRVRLSFPLFSCSFAILTRAQLQHPISRGLPKACFTKTVHPLERMLPSA